MDIYLEVGAKKTFAGALNWPGWCRIGSDKEFALHALFEYGPRYALILKDTGLSFQPPADISALNVVERLIGTGTTDFGAPDVAPSSDSLAMDHEDLHRSQKLLQACWHALNAAAQQAVGKELRLGPRGGGRDLEGVLRHVQGAEANYLSRIAWRLKKVEAQDLSILLNQTHQAVLEGLASAVQVGLPQSGPRGGVVWSPRYFVRRTAWHVLDHAWEIEDRIL